MRYTQPQSGARIDWGNPITRGLIIAPNYATMHDAVGKFPVPLYTRQVTNRGVGIYFDGTQTASSCRYSNAVSLEMRGAKSLLIQATINLTTAGQIVGVWGASGPQYQFLLRTEPDGAVMFGPYRQNSEVRIKKTVPGIAILGKTQSIVAYWNAYENVLYVVVDGIEYVANVGVWSAGVVPFLNENATEPMVLGCEGTSGSKITGTITSLQIYKNTIFTARSRASLSINPWQIFADNKKPIFIGVGAAGGGLSITAELATASASGHAATVNLQSAIHATLATATASGFTANVGTGNAITATLATATASGQTATVNRQSNITATQAVASASGNTATVNRHLAVAATLATATAAGQTATVNLQRSVVATQAAAAATGYAANVQLGNDLSISATQAAATASGFDAAINRKLSVSATLATATASGFTASVGTGNAITATLATATASGQTATVNQQSNIAATQAVASASGNTATVNRHLALAATLATATASGQTATVNLQRSVVATQAVATATGYTANVQLGNDLSISATQAAATASGFDAAINRQLSIAATLATATASGFDASISNGASIAASYGLASADGYQAQVNLQREIAASLATASASGFTAAISTSTGTAVWPTPDQVLSGITYGPTGADYAGTATAGGYPTAADIAAAVRADLSAELARMDVAISSRATVAAIMGATAP